MEHSQVVYLVLAKKKTHFDNKKAKIDSIFLLENLEKSIIFRTFAAKIKLELNPTSIII